MTGVAQNQTWRKTPTKWATSRRNTVTVESSSDSPKDSTRGDGHDQREPQQEGAREADDEEHGCDQQDAELEARR